MNGIMILINGIAVLISGTAGAPFPTLYYIKYKYLNQHYSYIFHKFFVYSVNLNKNIIDKYKKI